MCFTTDLTYALTWTFRVLRKCNLRRIQHKIYSMTTVPHPVLTRFYAELDAGCSANGSKNHKVIRMAQKRREVLVAWH